MTTKQPGNLPAGLPAMSQSFKYLSWEDKGDFQEIKQEKEYDLNMHD